MNPDSKNIDAVDSIDAVLSSSEQELRDARTTAYALGELDATERAEVERLLADPAQSEARSQVAQVRSLAATLKTASGDPGSERSADLRRAILAAVATPPAASTPGVSRGAKPRRPWPLVAALASLAAGMAVTATVFLDRTAERQVAVRRDAVEPAAALAATPRPTAPTEPAAPAPGPRASADAPMLAAPVARGFAAPADRTEAKSMPARERAPSRSMADARVQPPAPNSRQPVEVSGLERRPDMLRELSASGEGYATVSESRALSPREQPLSTFAIDVDTASYANVRRFLDAGRMPPRDAVRIEELLNYFRYDYPQPEGDAPFSVTVDATECPWKTGHRLVRIGLQGRQIDRGMRPAGNLVFLIDVSGSMNAPNKLPLVKQALAMLVEELNENDRVAIVTYAGNAGLVLPPTTGDQKRAIRAAIESLTPGGSTHGSAGITLAYDQAREHFIAGGSNRVILATDGDLNVGVTSTTALVDLIKQKAADGTFLTVLGFGDGNLQDDKMEALADNGNGVYAYIDGVREARKVLVEQLTGSTVTIAKDVKIQVEFNPARVASYRLLGYENRALAARDFRDDKKDAGEIGAGHSVTALYELVLTGEESPSGGAEPLKYQPQPEVKEPVAIDPNASQELLTVKLRWKQPEGETSSLTEVPLVDRGGAFEHASTDLRFVSAVAAFGMILRGSEQRGDATLPLVAKIAAGGLGRDEGGYRAEFLDLVRKAESVQ